MANYSSIKTPGAFVPQNSDYPTHEDIYGKGGYMVTTCASIPYDRRKVGMLVYDTSKSKIFKCTNVGSSGKFDATWEEFKTTDLDDLEIGGRNLLRDSNFTNKTSYNTNTYWLYFPSETYKGQYTLSLDNGWLKLSSTCTSYNSTTPRLGFQQTGLNGNDEFNFVLSFDAYASTPVKFNASSGYGTRLPETEVTIGTSKSRYSFVVRGYNGGAESYNIFFACITESTTADIWFNNFKLEKGNKPTDWTPALEDYLDLTTMKALSAKTADSATTASSASVANYAKYINELTGSYDLNQLDPTSFCISHNFNSLSSWKNAPSGFSYGHVVLLSCSNGMLVTQLGFDSPAVNGNKASTNNFWVRTGAPNYYKNENIGDTTIASQNASWNLSEWKRVAWAEDASSGFVLKTGDTMTGSLVLNYNGAPYSFGAAYNDNDSVERRLTNADLVVGYTGQNSGLRTAFNRSSLQTYLYNGSDLSFARYSINPLGGNVQVGPANTTTTVGISSASITYNKTTGCLEITA